ncbi:tRNA (adenosine(37)-N6)-dimethylallyltransferase MiaA [Litorilituus sediminis]|uniref:tRNA dimethylallyltransferase n=1 Tax=Litorilituus sediminis TaxID=718192 RepID=A0A4P6P7N3_9GAMM|nr:tRNA (adenosine(37)-N6)-dimethylallyltransferase MiaA [Litorilituus sediminis]QBG37554.1 tRNA (adenosine(37)-N6)-dimethylallyltransferase MiaA [Litorilituus sediminis]
MQNKNLVVVFGATASGKTRLGIELANHFNGEIISADSRQVYKGLDIGSGKDLHEYGNTPYHLIDIVEPTQEYNAFQYQQDFYTCFTELQNREKLAVLVGGTGLYIDAVTTGYDFQQVDKNTAQRDEFDKLPLAEVQALLKQLDSAAFATTDITVRPRLYRAIEIAQDNKINNGNKNNSNNNNNNKQLAEKPTISPIYLGISWDRKILRQRITARLKERLEQGMIAEVEQLHAQGLSHEKLEFFGLEYRFVSQYLRKQISYDDMFEKLNIAIHKYAKRQDTWFRRIERRGDKVHWLDGSDNPTQHAYQVLKEYNF